MEKKGQLFTILKWDTDLSKAPMNKLLLLACYNKENEDKKYIALAWTCEELNGKWASDNTILNCGIIAWAALPELDKFFGKELDK